MQQTRTLFMQAREIAFQNMANISSLLEQEVKLRENYLDGVSTKATYQSEIYPEVLSTPFKVIDRFERINLQNVTNKRVMRCYFERKNSVDEDDNEKYSKLS